MIACNVAQLLKAPTGTVRRVEVEETDPELAAELHLVSPTRGRLRLMRTAAGILVAGTLKHRVEETCSRCLETFTREQVIELNEEFVPVIDVFTGLAAAEPLDADAFRLTPDHMLELDEAIRQYGILEDPLQPLCSPGCKGLCSSCGANLNLGPCGCEAGERPSPTGSFGTLLAERLRQAGFQPEQK